MPGVRTRRIQPSPSSSARPPPARLGAFRERASPRAGHPPRPAVDKHEQIEHAARAARGVFHVGRLSRRLALRTASASNNSSACSSGGARPPTAGAFARATCSSARCCGAGLDEGASCERKSRPRSAASTSMRTTSFAGSAGGAIACVRPSGMSQQPRAPRGTRAARRSQAPRFDEAGMAHGDIAVLRQTAIAAALGFQYSPTGRNAGSRR